MSPAVRAGAPSDDGAETETGIARALFGPSAGADPMAVLRQARVPGCRYAVADSMLRDPRLGPPMLADRRGPLFEMLGRWMIRLDGDRHREIRSRVAAALTADRVAVMRPGIERIAESLLGPRLPFCEMELVADFARPLPLITILGVLGVPPRWHRWVEDKMNEVLRGLAAQHSDPAAVDRAHDATVALEGLIWDLLQERRADPQDDDLLSDLAATLSSARVDNADLIANCVFFIAAGHATTTTLIAGGVVLLLENPEQLAELRRDLSLLPSAIEELLRLLSPTTTVPKRLRDDRDADGFWIGAGELRRAFLGAANRDPDIYTDPDQLKISRSEARHLAFGAGRHFCLGAPLARLIAEIALAGVLNECQGLRLDGQAQWRSAMPLRELERVPLAWDPPAPNQ